jgi:predicted phosphodiesterase
VIFGHSDIPIDADTEYGEGLFTPGSPRGSAGSPRATYGQLTIQDGGFRTRIIELP